MKYICSTVRVACWFGAVTAVLTLILGFWEEYGKLYKISFFNDFFNVVLLYPSMLFIEMSGLYNVPVSDAWSIPFLALSCGILYFFVGAFIGGVVQLCKRIFAKT